ncbi:MAG TPA: ABC-type transport auxiliary lipoprotein family protein [Desulfomonilaceae bacterium]|nr:ABC-type transport auxiliary lipoprotein family protein [Desulfomonilaceae bacterium]
MADFCYKLVAWSFGLGITFLCANCAWHAKAIHYYAFDYPSPPKMPGPQIGETLMVYRFLLDRSVPVDSLAISESTDGRQTLNSYRWEENPADMITDLVLRDFQSSDMFERAVDQLGTVRYRYSVEGTIRTLQGSIRNGKALAVLETDVTVTDFEAPKGAPKTIVKKSYLIEVPSADSKPESIMKGLNSAVKQLSENIRHDVRSALSPTGALDRTQPHIRTSQSLAALRPI